MSERAESRDVASEGREAVSFAYTGAVEQQKYVHSKG